MQYAGHFKMVLLGDADVGKTSLALRLVKARFVEHTEATIGAAFFTHSVQLHDGRYLKIELWDTAGAERYQSLAPMYYRDAPAGLVVYDITNHESFHRAMFWVKQLRETNGPEMAIALAGNKHDLATDERRAVGLYEARKFASEHNLIFMETSARLGENIAEIFLAVAERVALRYQPDELTGSKKMLSSMKSSSSDTACCSGRK